MKKLILLLLILPFFFACKDDASSSSEPETKPVVQGRCGDGKLNEGEDCDGTLFRDKNLPADVQCSSTCLYDYSMVQVQP